MDYRIYYWLIFKQKIHSVDPEAANMDTTKESVIKSDQFFNEAVRIGEQLVKEAILSRNERTATWIGLNPNYLGQLGMSGLRGGLYDGTGGIFALFCAFISNNAETTL
ncbi:hypothetical protein HMSSN036_08280 [Paenibacillus macerans]|nr:hypothetical protein HMSSN036_08280 [Paenibacillus macerans]